MDKTFSFADGSAVYLKSILINLALQFSLSFIAGIILISLKIDITKIIAINLLFMAIIQVFNFFIFYYDSSKKKLNTDSNYKKIPGISSILIVLGLSIVCFLGFYGFASLFQLLLDTIGFKSMGGIEFNTLFEIIVAFIITCLLAPIGEELVFRGALLTGLKSKFGTYGAILLSSLAFSLMHMNPEQTVYQFLLGIAFAYVAIKSKSLILAIIMHSANNMIAMLLSLIPSFGNAIINIFNFLLSNLFVGAAIFILITAGALVIIFYVGKFLERKTFTTVMNEVKSPARAVRREIVGTVISDENIEIKENHVNQENRISGGYVGMFGKFTGHIYYYGTLAICAIMWFSIFISGLMK